MEAAVVGKTSRRPSRAHRKRDWFGRPDVEHYTVWYDQPDKEAKAKEACLQFLDARYPGHDRAGLEWLAFTADEARQFVRYARREAATFALIKHYNEIEDLLRHNGGTVLVMTIPAVHTPGEP